MKHPKYVAHDHLVTWVPKQRPWYPEEPEVVCIAPSKHIAEQVAVMFNTFYGRIAPKGHMQPRPMNPGPNWKYEAMKQATAEREELVAQMRKEAA